MNKFFKNLLKFSLILLSSLNCGLCRELSVDVNPDCPNNCNDYKPPVNLVHIKSKGDKDIVHYLWSSITCIPPTLLIVETGLNSNLTIDWNKLMANVCLNPKEDHLSDAITFTNTTNALGIQISRLFLFNDNNKKGSFDKKDKTLELNWKDFDWHNIRQNEQDKNSVQFTFNNVNSGQSEDLHNASVAFNLKVVNSEGRGQELPHLAFTQKSVSLQINVNNVQTEEYFKKFNESDRPRLMADVFVMTFGETAKKNPEFESITSIDDEYTPGVFRRFILDLKNGDKEVKNSFLSWKPIAYNSDERIIANTLDVIQGEIQTFNSSQLEEYNSRIFESFFNVNKNGKYRFDVTFGAPDDETYYNEHRFNSFSVVVGVDSAPDEELSFLVKIIIVVGFGLPLIVMVISALYLIVRKIRKRKFNDLLLSQSQQTLND